MVSIEVPEELATVLEAVVAAFDSFDAENGDFGAAERGLMEKTAELETKALLGMLLRLDPDCPQVEFQGKRYRRLRQPGSGVYSGLRGELRVPRALYREMGVKNGPTIVPMELRAGIVEGRFTPAAAKSVAVLAQALPSREADLVARTMQVLPYSRSAQFRAGVAIGTAWEAMPDEAKAGVDEELEIPEEAVSVSVAVDRVSMPMAEPRPLTADDIDRGVKNPITVQLRMAFAAVTTVYDAEGTPLMSVRHAHVPTGGRAAMETALSGDLDWMLDKRPDLQIVALSDGAGEMQSIVDRAVEGRDNVAARITDFWHLTEHLADALRDTGRYVPDQLGDWKGELLAHDSAIDDIEMQLRNFSAEYGNEPVPKGLHEALTFIENRRERLRYATTHKANLPIGSGTVEATCKTIVSTRMKRPGARWKEDGAQPILALRALATSVSTRWDAAMTELLATYRRQVILLPSPA